jgi:PadR family transcriptional regulator, regulatory protein AphA
MATDTKQDIQLTPTSFIVLGLLSNAEQATPYELKQMAGATVGQFWSLSHSQVYAEPERLARAGYLSEKREQGGRRRKRYSLTAKGRKAFEAWRDEPSRELYELRDPGLLQLAAGAHPARLAEAQLETHKQKLAELEQMRSTFDLTDAPESYRLVCECGIGHEREYVRFWSRLAKASGKPKRSRR